MTEHTQQLRGHAPARAKFSPQMKEGGKWWSTIYMRPLTAPADRRQAPGGTFPHPVGVPLCHPATAAVETEASRAMLYETPSGARGRVCDFFTQLKLNASIGHVIQRSIMSLHYFKGKCPHYGQFTPMMPWEHTCPACCCNWRKSVTLSPFPVIIILG